MWGSRATGQRCTPGELPGENQSTSSVQPVSRVVLRRFGWFPRGRWSDDLASDPDLSSPAQSEQELGDKEEESPNEDDGGDHVLPALDGRERSSLSEPVDALPHKHPKVVPARAPPAR